MSTTNTAPSPSVGLGSTTAIGGIVFAAAAFLTAAIDAGLDETPFYSDPGVLTLFGALITAVVGFFAGRSYQQGKLYQAHAAMPPLPEIEYPRTPTPVVGRDPLDPPEVDEPPAEPTDARPHEGADMEGR